MTGPTRAPATLTADLAALSERATPGPYYALDGDGMFNPSVGTRDEQPSMLDALEWVAEMGPDGHVNAAYIAALVNGHRAGHLVALDAALDWVAEQLADPEVVEVVAGFSTASQQWVRTAVARAALDTLLAAFRDRAASLAPQPDTTHDTKEQP